MRGFIGGVVEEHGVECLGGFSGVGFMDWFGGSVGFLWKFCSGGREKGDR